MLTAASELVIQIKDDVKLTSVKALENVRKDIEKLEGTLSEKARKAFEGVIDKAIELSKTPFLDSGRMAEAERITQSLANRVQRLRGEQEQLGKITSKLNDEYKKTASRVVDYGNEVRAVRSLNKELEAKARILAEDAKKEVSKPRKAQMDAELQNMAATYQTNQQRIAQLQQLQAAEKQNLAVQKWASDQAKVLAAVNSGNLKLAEQALNSYVRGIDASKMKMQQLFNQQQNLLQNIFKTQMKYIKDPVAQQQLIELAERVSKLNLGERGGRTGLQQAQKDLAKLNSEILANQANMGIVGRAYEKFKTVFSRVFDALLAFTIINWGQKIFGTFFSGMINFNAQLEQMDARLSRLVPTDEERNRVREFMKEYTITTPFKIEEVVEAAVTLRAFGLDIADNMKTVGDWAAAVGKDLNDTALAYSKIIQFSPRTALLLTTRGLSLTAFESYVKKYGDRATALARLVEDTFGGAAEKVSLTFKGLLSNISDVWNFIASEAGKPLFESLKRDIRTIYNLLTQLKDSGQETLSVFGQFIKSGVYTAGFAAIAVVIGIIVDRMKSFIASIRAGQMGSIALWSSIKSTAVMTAVSALVMKYFQYRDAVKEVNDAVNELANTEEDNHTKRIAQIEQIIEGYEEQISVGSRMVVAITQVLKMLTFQAGLGQILMEAEQWDTKNEKMIKYYNEQLSKEKQLAADVQRRLMIENAEFSMWERKDYFKNWQEMGLMPILDRSLARLKQIREELTTFEFAGQRIPKPSYAFTETMKNEIARNEGLIKAVESAMKPPSDSEFAKELEKIYEMLTEGKITPIQFRQELAELGREWDKFSKKSGRKTDMRYEFEELLRDVQGLKNEINSLFDNSTKKRAQFDKLQGSLRETFPQGVTEEAVNQYLADTAEIESAVAAMVKIAKESGTEITSEAGKKLLKELQQRKNVEADIVKYLNLKRDLTAQEKEELADAVQWAIDRRQLEENAINQLREYNELIGMYDASEQKKILQSVLDEYKTTYSQINKEVDTLNLRLKNTSLNEEERKELNLQLRKLTKDQYQEYGKILSIMQRIFGLPSESFGEAMYKNLIKARQESEKLYDILAETMYGESRTAIRNILGDILKNPNADLDKQIEAQRFELEKIQQTKKGIVIVEDKEAEVLARINELEEQRITILSRMSDMFDRIIDKLLDMAATEVANQIWEGLSDIPNLFKGGVLDTPGQVASGGAGASMIRPTVPNESKTVVNQIVFQGNVYGSNDFNKQVETAVMSMNRRLK